MSEFTKLTAELHNDQLELLKQIYARKDRQVTELQTEVKQLKRSIANKDNYIDYLETKPEDRQ